MKKTIKKYFSLVLKLQLVAGIISTFFAFKEGIKNNVGISAILLTAIVGFVAAIPIVLIGGLIAHYTAFSEKSQKDLKKIDKFWGEIAKEAKENNERKCLLSRNLFLIALIVFILLPVCWYGFKNYKDNVILIPIYCLFAFLTLYGLYWGSLVKLSGRKLVKMDKENNQEKFISK